MLGAGGCGEDEDDVGCASASPEDHEEIRLEVREPRGASSAQVQEAVRIVCERTEALGLEDAAVRAEDTGSIVVSVPPDRAAKAGPELARAARLRFYAWEANLIPGGGTAEKPLASYREAERVAATRPDGIALRAEPPLRGFIAIRNRPVLRNEDVESVALDADPVTGGPSITIEFSSSGRRRFAELTRQVSGQSTPESPARFAVAVDAEIVAIPEVDPKTARTGSGAPAVSLVGAIAFGEAKVLTELLEIGFLPIDLALRRSRTG